MNWLTILLIIETHTTRESGRQDIGLNILRSRGKAVVPMSKTNAPLASSIQGIIEILEIYTN